MKMQKNEARSIERPRGAVAALAREPRCHG
jgi:hypothetical protein